MVVIFTLHISDFKPENHIATYKAIRAASILLALDEPLSLPMAKGVVDKLVSSGGAPQLIGEHLSEEIINKAYESLVAAEGVQAIINFDGKKGIVPREVPAESEDAEETPEPTDLEYKQALVFLGIADGKLGPAIFHIDALDALRDDLSGVREALLSAFPGIVEVKESEESK